MSAVELHADIWGAEPSDLCEERSSRQFPVSSFSTVPHNPILDYWELERVLDSIQERLDALKIDYARRRGVPVEEAFPAQT